MKKRANKITINCNKMNSRGTIELCSKILEITKKDYQDLPTIDVQIYAENKERD